MMRSRSAGASARTLRERWRRVAQDRRADHARRRALERAPSGRELVEHDAEREHVGAAVDGLAAHLLRRHVGHRAHDLTGSRERPRHGLGLRCQRRVETGVRRFELREPEVEHLHAPVARQHHVRGLDVAVHHALLVRRRQRLGDARRPARRRARPAARLAPACRSRPSPSTSSMVRNRVPSSSSTENSVTMFGWFREATVRASRSNRARRPASEAKPAGSTLSATSRPSRRSLAR